MLTRATRTFVHGRLTIHTGKPVDTDAYKLIDTIHTGGSRLTRRGRTFVNVGLTGETRKSTGTHTLVAIDEIDARGGTSCSAGHRQTFVNVSVAVLTRIPRPTETQVAIQLCEAGAAVGTRLRDTLVRFRLTEGSQISRDARAAVAVHEVGTSAPVLAGQ